MKASIFYLQNSFKSLALLFTLLIAAIIWTTTSVYAKDPVKGIIFIPQDSRPVSSEQTAEIMENLGYNVEMPPKDLLGNRTTPGKRKELFQWLEAHAHENKIAVIGSDNLIYGGLVNSRKHNYDLTSLEKQVDKLEDLHKDFPKMPIYVFSSIMRTPRNAAASGTEDADYYKKYGALIASYTKIDGADTSKLSEPYQVLLRQEDTQRALKDWRHRRQINFTVNKKLIDLTKKGVITYLLIGRDDNDTGSVTDQESQALTDYARRIGTNRQQLKVIAGIDELGMLSMARIANQLANKTPKVYVEYAFGFGPATVPSYSNEAIDSTITDEIYVTNARRVFSPREADLVFLINTNQSGWTYDANTPVNTTKLRFNSQDFLDKIKHYVNAKKPVAIGDIAFANGSDNALMEQMFKAHLLDKVYGYAGWNTATNSTGSALSIGLIALNLNQEQRKKTLATRYLDDWLYQSNVRQDVNGYLSLLPGPGDYLDIGKVKLEPAETYGTRRINAMREEYLKNFSIPNNLRITLPWNRIFEADFITQPQYKIFNWH